MEALSLGDRMKYYERLCDNTVEYNNVYLIRLDGNNFSKRIRSWKLNRPFDLDFHFAMLDTCKELMDLIPHSRLLWTGSDEITIVCMVNQKKDAWFGNRLNKILSLSAAYTSVLFNKYMKQSGFDMDKYPAFFDSRVITVPTIEEACNNVLSRYNDCKKNSISMWADSVFTHKELLNKNSDVKIEMMKTKDLDWYASKIPLWSKYGSIIYKEQVELKVEENNKNITLKNNSDCYIRNVVRTLDLNADVNMFEIFEKYVIKKEEK